MKPTGGFLRPRREIIVESEGLKWYWQRGTNRLFGETHELGPRKALLDELSSESVFYDVGANVGAYSLPAAKKGARVVSFEPSPASAALLRRNLKLNNLGADILPVALSDAVGVYTTGDRYHEERQSSRRGLWVRVPLDSIVDDLPPPSLIKIDVEGQEARVLSGAIRALKEFSPILFVEYHTHFGITREVIADFCEQRGYEVQDMGNNRVIAKPII
jgi:FkbM family methyltransferase